MRKVVIPVLIIVLIASTWFGYEWSVDRPSEITEVGESSFNEPHTSPILVNQVEEVSEEDSDPEVGAAEITTNVEGLDIRTWPDSPGVMESLILHELAQLRHFRLVSVVSSECTETVCELRYVTMDRRDNALWAGNPIEHTSFFERFDNPPYDAFWAVGVSGSESEGFVHRVTLRSNPFPLPTEQELAEQHGTAAGILRRNADRMLGSDVYASPVSLGSYEGARVIGENVCSVDCPLDLQRMIYVEVEEGKTCEQLQGSERVILARDSDGRFRERIFCVPDFLVEK